MRKNTICEYANGVNAKLIIENEYGLRRFISDIYPDFCNRCGYCYRTRLEKTAEFAKQNRFDAFTSTLFISPYQNHELMKEIALESAEKYGVEFLYRDFRPYFKEGQEKARELDLYMQKYCGCIFSEEDRYTKKKK
jgi:predicted adenine nucleotide alpha hydrolase (AANH) superfamily ATPase